MQEPARDAPESRSLAAQIADALRDEIVQGSLTVAERLPSESELAGRFGVSVATVREALKLLAAKKLIRSKRGPKGGVFVNAPSLALAGEIVQDMMAWFVGLGVIDLADIVESRLQLGRVCVRLAAERASEQELDAIAATLAPFGRDGITDEEFCRLDVAFHHAIAAATGNNELHFIMLMVNDSLIPATNMIAVRYRERERVFGFHARILAALRRRDAAEAVAAFEGLIAYLSEVYDRALEGRREPGGGAAGA